jgi:hypothetical protein
MLNYRCHNKYNCIQNPHNKPSIHRVIKLLQSRICLFRKIKKFIQWDKMNSPEETSLRSF